MYNIHDMRVGPCTVAGRAATSLRVPRRGLPPPSPGVGHRPRVAPGFSLGVRQPQLYPAGRGGACPCVSLCPHV